MNSRMRQSTARSPSWCPANLKLAGFLGRVGAMSGRHRRDTGTLQRHIRRRHGLYQAGSSTFEFTLLLPMLCLLLFGIVEFSFGMYDKTVIANASREAAREGVSHSAPRLTSLQITGIARNYASDHLITFGSSSSVAVDVDQSSGTASGDPLKVTVSYAYRGLAIGKVTDMLGGSVVLSAVTTMDYQ